MEKIDPQLSVVDKIERELDVALVRVRDGEVCGLYRKTELSENFHEITISS